MPKHIFIVLHAGVHYVSTGTYDTEALAQVAGEIFAKTFGFAGAKILTDELAGGVDCCETQNLQDQR